MTEREVQGTWSSANPPGVAVVCGAVSGNLEMTELEGPHTGADVLEQIGYECQGRGVSELWESMISGGGYVEWTPTGGLHFLYRISDHDVPGNTKIAQAPDPENRGYLKTRAETRGEGGYVIVAPSPGACHPSGQDWWALPGCSPATIPTITWAQRNHLHSAIRAVLDLSPPPPPEPEKRSALLPDRGPLPLRPGDDFNARCSWDTILIPHGWTRTGQRGTEVLWTRPGKDGRDGHSASTGYAADADRMFVWSTSAGLPSETPLSKFFVYTELNHGGDWVASTRDLSAQGFGAGSRIGVVPAEELVVVGDPMDALESVGKVPLKGDIHPSIQYTDTGNSMYMETQANGKIRYNASRNQWLIYENGRWRADPRGTDVRDIIKVWARQRQEHARMYGTPDDVKACTQAMNIKPINAAMELLKGAVNTRPKDWDADPSLLNLTNGTFNLRTMTMQKHDPKDLLTKQMGVAFDPEATCPNFDRFMAEAVPDPEVRTYLQRMVGYTMMGNPVERALMVLHGPGGTGKSTFIETMAKLFDDYGVTATDAVFRAKRDGSVGNGPTNDLAILQGARMVSMSELDYGHSMDESLIKRMTGRDRITSRRSYEENETWTPQCVIWLGTNHNFRVNGDDAAIWDRIKKVNFTVRPAKKDKYLSEKLEAELPGILNWALAGLVSYHEIGLDEPDAVTQAIAEYRDEQDDVFQFIKAMLEDGQLVDRDDAVIKKTALYHLYSEWCRLEGNRFPLGQRRFNARMKDGLGYQVKKRGNLLWVGLGLPLAQAARSWYVEHEIEAAK